jgi:Rrf2 family iron-sulfur cluster assembly transcriptional regulator
MRLTTRGRYAVTAMLDLALNAAPKPVPLGDIAERQGISLAYLEQLFARLRRGGLVASVRGPGGGYRLSEPLESISIARIIAAVDEQLDATRCGGSGRCQDGQQCLTHDLWTDLSARIEQFLSQHTLASLVAREAVQEVAERQRAGQREGDALIAAMQL